MVCRLHVMSELLKIFSIPGHHFNKYQLFMMPNQPMRQPQPLLLYQMLNCLHCPS
jgi:hypothetical protein